MAQTTREKAANLLLSHKRYVRYLVVLACTAAVVILGVALSLRQSGQAATYEVTILDCQYAGNGAHTHNDDCYDADGNLVCPLEERELHIHDDSCYTHETTLVCGREESEGHKHDESCYDEEGNLICGQGPAFAYAFAFALVDALGGDSQTVKNRTIYYNVFDVPGGVPSWETEAGRWPAPETAAAPSPCANS